MLFLKKKNLNFIYFIRKDDVLFLTSSPFFISKLNVIVLSKFFLWKSINEHFLWKLRTAVTKAVNLSSEFFKKFGNYA